MIFNPNRPSPKPELKTLDDHFEALEVAIYAGEFNLPFFKLLNFCSFTALEHERELDEYQQLEAKVETRRQIAFAAVKPEGNVLAFKPTGKVAYLRPLPAIGGEVA